MSTILSRRWYVPTFKVYRVGIRLTVLENYRPRDWYRLRKGDVWLIEGTSGYGGSSRYHLSRDNEQGESLYGNTIFWATGDYLARKFSTAPLTTTQILGRMPVESCLQP